MPQIAETGFTAITRREANPVFVDLGVNTGMSTEIGNKTQIKVIRAITIALAETEGFEPSVQMYPYDGLANRWFQPLTHVSRSQRRGRAIARGGGGGKGLVTE